MYYGTTGFACVWWYRKTLTKNLRDFFMQGVIPFLGGAILYVVGEVWASARRFGHRTLGLHLLAAGFMAGVATDLIVTYGGA